MSAIRLIFSAPVLSRAVFVFLLFIIAEEAAWLAVLLYAHDVGGVGAVGFVAVIQLVPAMFIAPFSATLVDRMSRKKGLLVAYGSVSITVIATGIAVLQQAEPIVVYILAICITILVTLGRPAHYAALPALAQTPSRLVAANAVTGTLEGLGVLLGPLVVALTISFVSLQTVFLFVGVLLGLGAVPLLVAKSEEIEGEPGAICKGESFFTSVIQGVVQVRRIPGAFPLLLLVGIGYVLQGALDVLAVEFAMDVLKAGEVGVSTLAGANGIGLLLGATATVVFVGRAKLVPIYILASVCTGLFMAYTGYTETLFLAAALIACSGIARAIADVLGNTLLHRNVDEAAMARVFGIQEAVLNGGMALGAAVVPLVILMVGTRDAFVVIGIILPLLAVLGYSKIRALDLAGVESADILKLLKSIHLFTPLYIDTLEWLASSVNKITVPKGCVVVTEGEEGDLFYVVRSGQTQVLQNGKEVNRIETNGYFGELALLNDTTRNATIVALEETELLVLEREVFLHALTGGRQTATVSI